MVINKAYKTELDPNNIQRTLLGRYAGAARYVYNWGLAEWKAWYERGDKPSHFKVCKAFNASKDETCPWIRQIPYAVTESAFRNLGAAFQGFFRRVANGDKEKGYPKFKKRGCQASFQLRHTKVEATRVRLTGVGWIRLKERSYIPTSDSDCKFGTYATMSEHAGRWYISVQTQEEIEQPEVIDGLALGIDLGIASLAVCSDGTVFANPKPLVAAQKKLARLNRELSRRERGGSNWRKTKNKLARQHARVQRIRQHCLHQISHDVIIAKRPSAIGLEDLNVSGMVQNRHLAKAISDVGFYELRRQIDYKGEWNGTEVVIADRWYPSSKTCSKCGASVDELPLSVRTFQCPTCGLEMDRDLNAARNLAALAKAETQPDCLGS